MVFEREILIRFQHCDTAGIVFYPRYFEMFNQVVEDWFADALGADFKHLHVDLREGVPTVRTECEFLRPSRVGDRLMFRLALERLGRSSFTLAINASLGGEQRLRAKLVLAYVALGDTITSIPIPNPLREAMQHYLIDDTAT